MLRKARVIILLTVIIIHLSINGTNKVTLKTNGEKNSINNVFETTSKQAIDITKNRISMYLDIQEVKIGDIITRRTVNSVKEDEKRKTITFTGSFIKEGKIVLSKDDFLIFTPNLDIMLPRTKDNHMLQIEFDNKEDILSIKEINDFLQTITPIDDTIINGIYVTMAFSNYRYIYDKQNGYYKILAHFDKIISIDE